MMSQASCSAWRSCIVPLNLQLYPLHPRIRTDKVAVPDFTSPEVPLPYTDLERRHKAKHSDPRQCRCRAAHCCPRSLDLEDAHDSALIRLLPSLRMAAHTPCRS